MKSLDALIKSCGLFLNNGNSNFLEATYAYEH